MSALRARERKAERSRPPALILELSHLVHKWRRFVPESSSLHHFCLSEHSLSQRTRLTERRVLACDRLILAHLGFADLRTAHPFFDPFGRPKPPFRHLFLCFLRTSANPSVGRESSIHAGFSSFDFLGVRFGHAEGEPPGIETARRFASAVNRPQLACESSRPRSSRLLLPRAHLTPPPHQRHSVVTSHGCHYHRQAVQKKMHPGFSPVYADQQGGDDRSHCPTCQASR